MKKKTKKTKARTCPAQKSQGLSRVPIVLAIALTFIAAAVIAGVVTFWCQQWRGSEWEKRNKEVATQNLEAQVNSLRKEMRDLKQNNGSSTSDASANASKSASDEFEKAVNAKDFTKAESLMANKIMYVVDASDCCGNITKTEAASNMKKYLSGVKSFNFSQDQQVVRQMKVNLAKTFAKYTIGIADNKMVLSYHLNAQQKVDDIFISASHLMYDLE